MAVRAVARAGTGGLQVVEELRARPKGTTHVVELANCGHVPMDDQAAELVQALSSFALASLGASRLESQQSASGSRSPSGSPLGEGAGWEAAAPRDGRREAEAQSLPTRGLATAEVAVTGARS